MVDMNAIIANNILACLKKQNKKQVDLAEAIGMTKQTVHKMLNGSRMINAVELKKIADYLGVNGRVGANSRRNGRVKCCSSIYG